ncbi:circadian clock-controlled protein daywake-like [Macrosteles quadrilineatus]|uniref:circadian clock-controlled protein daywake-like n=1 Tax=Macrosteles quadrilineatus TaxID=74068 RepID=UPI0023E22285|nr:circadian clock-controlled protein daywake-like [Macrosteles quadrilineatus]
MWFCLYVLALAAVAVAEIPSAPCKIKAEDFDQCLLNAFRQNIPKLSKSGIKELNMPPLDPFYVPQVLITYNGSEITAKSLVRNSFTHGLRNVQILDIRTNLDNPEKQVIEGDIFLPKVLVEGTYKTEGNLGNFPVNGKGVYNISMTNVSATIKVEGHLVTLKDKVHLKVHKVGLSPEVGGMKIYASNLINGNKELSELALNVVNQFWRMFYVEMLPYAEQGFDEVLRGAINKYTLNVPYDQMWQVE